MIEIVDYIPNGIEKNILESIGTIQAKKSDKSISAKEIALFIYGEKYIPCDVVYIHNVLRKLNIKGLVRRISPNAPTKDHKVGWLLDGSAVKSIL